MSREQEVIDIVAEQLGIDRAEIVSSKAFVEDLNADSLDLTELMMTLESRFNCEISEEETSRLRTVGDVINFVNSKEQNPA